MDPLLSLRRFFAAEIEALCDLQTPALVEALANVPREAFLPPGPWVVRSELDYVRGSRRTRDSDPRRVYRNLAVAIDPERQLFNGAPSLLALCIDQLRLEAGGRVLHVGSGPGYYSAVMAECVGRSGEVVAVEIDQALAADATRNLAPWPQVRVRCGDGVGCDGWFDAIMINAGVTHPQDAWLDAMKVGGRMILPLTATMPAMGPLGKGVLLLLTRGGPDYGVTFVSPVFIYSALGLRDPELNERLGQVLMRGGLRPGVRRLRRDVHAESRDCWFHGPRFCLS